MKPWEMDTGRSLFENIFNCKMNQIEDYKPPKPLKSWSYDEVLEEGTLQYGLKETDEGYHDKEQAILKLMAEHCRGPSFRIKGTDEEEEERYMLYITTEPRGEEGKMKQRYWLLYSWNCQCFMSETDKEQFDELGAAVKGVLDGEVK